MPNSATSRGVAFVVAIAALTAAIVGALVGGATSYLVDEARSRNAAEGAARVYQSEFRDETTRLAAMLDRGRAIPVPASAQIGLDTDGKQLIASQLEPEEWLTVVSGETALNRGQRRERESAVGKAAVAGKAIRLGQGPRQKIKDRLATGNRAIKTLAPLAGNEEELSGPLVKSQKGTRRAGGANSSGSPRGATGESPSGAGSVERDWLDWLPLLVGLASLLIAGVAALFARNSASEARRSGDAAERTAQTAEETAGAARKGAEQSRELARIASEQHDLLVGGRERGPEFDIELAFDGVLHPTTGTTPGSITWPTVLRATFRNLGGKEADGALVTIFVPSTVELGPCGPKGAGASEFLALAPAEEELESGGPARRRGFILGESIGFRPDRESAGTAFSCSLAELHTRSRCASSTRTRTLFSSATAFLSQRTARSRSPTP